MLSPVQPSSLLPADPSSLPTSLDSPNSAASSHVPPPQKTENGDEVFQERSIFQDAEYFKSQGEKESTSECEIIINGILEGFDDEMRNVVPDMLTTTEVTYFIELWNKLTTWLLIFKLMSDSKNIIDETTIEHQTCRRFFHVSKKFDIDSEAFIQEFDGRYFIQRVIRQIPDASNKLIYLFSSSIDFYMTSDVGIALLVCNGAVQVMKNRISMNRKHTGTRTILYADFLKILDQLERKEKIFQYIEARFKNTALPKKSTYAHFSYQKSTCFLVASLEMCVGIDDVWRILRNHDDQSLTVPEAEQFPLRAISTSLNVLWKNQEKTINTAALMEILELKTLGLPINREGGGSTKELMKCLIRSNANLRRMFTYRCESSEGTIEADVLNIQTLEKDEKEGEGVAYFIRNLKFEVCPPKLAVFVNSPKPSIHCIPLWLERKDETSVKYSLSAFTTETIETTVKHAIAYMKMEHNWSQYNQGKRKAFNFSTTPVECFSFGIFEKETDSNFKID
ncbi:hypothetical protein CRE_10960 [Caenorhabditis remanei]|uniref:Uncharacterized protein n=1 Tax=Caenorhabditis remanei TaxID=31234 RepID=E3M5R3_CAERE|nr:hypothetical protein CRE_10960 [Caenorhabditis remanei]